LLSVTLISVAQKPTRALSLFAEVPR